MSSTYVHYSAPSSLPSDYALLSRYAAAHDQVVEDSDANSALLSAEIDDHDDAHEENGVDIRGGNPRGPRRGSFQTSYLAPFNPTMGPLPDEYGHRSGPKPSDPNENTPLLAPPIPRIEEECDREDASDPHNSSKIFWEEIGILTKYTLPVFGYVYSGGSTYPLPILTQFSFKNTSFRVLARYRGGSVHWPSVDDCARRVHARVHDCKCLRI